MININQKQINFLYKEMEENVSLVRVGEVKGLNKEVRQQYQEIYNATLDVAFVIDWQCHSCAVNAIKKIYNATSAYEHNVIAPKAPKAPKAEGKGK